MINQFFYRNIAMSMGLTKTSLFTTEQNELAQFAKVLGHPARIAIVQYLLTAKTCVNSSLVEELGLAQATVSQHLKELKTAKIITGSIEGSSVCYCINTIKWNEIQTKLNGLFKQLTVSTNDCC